MASSRPRTLLPSAPDRSQGEQTLDIAFDSVNSTIPQMISFTSIPQLLYTVGGATDHFAIGIQNLPASSARAA